MEMCTALLRVRGTLLRRGPWVMEGQLRLGTSPALRTRTGTVSEPRTVPEPRVHDSSPAWVLRLPPPPRGAGTEPLGGPGPRGLHHAVPLLPGSYR